MKRKQALVSVIAYCAETGIVDKHAMRIYVESRLSYKAFQEAAARGVAIYKRRKDAEAK